MFKNHDVCKLYDKYYMETLLNYKTTNSDLDSDLDSGLDSDDKKIIDKKKCFI